MGPDRRRTLRRSLSKSSSPSQSHSTRLLNRQCWWANEHAASVGAIGFALTSKRVCDLRGETVCQARLVPLDPPSRRESPSNCVKNWFVRSDAELCSERQSPSGSRETDLDWKVTSIRSVFHARAETAKQRTHSLVEWVEQCLPPNPLAERGGSRSTVACIP